MTPVYDPRRVRIARAVAVAVDLAQLAATPFPGIGTALVVGLDVAAAVFFCVYLRPHWAFAPTFLAEAVPLVDVVPFWTLAVVLVTRGQGGRPTVPPPPLEAPRT